MLPARRRDGPSRLAELATRLKPAARGAIDRVAQPYVDRAVDRIASVIAGGPTAGALPPQFTDLQEALHEARTLALADVPPGARRMLSAGASGAWYFEWVASTYGPVERHVGVEAYSPRPDILPENVEWIAADISGPGGIGAVDSHSIDLVYSGQNLEHLWPSQMAAFFTEANRVVRDDGLLVVDSPNRALTAAYRWSMGEHTVELLPSEAESLLRAGGFSVERMKGVWLCRSGGELMDLGPDPTAPGAHGLIRRFALAAQRPDDSFIWWAEARRVAEPDPAALARLAREVFADNWHERVSRLQVHEAVPRPWPDGRPGVVALPGAPAVVLTGPSMPIPSGAFTVEMEIAWSGCGGGDGPVARLEVVAGADVLGSAEVRPGSQRDGSATVLCPIQLDRLRFGVGIRLVSTGRAELRAPLSLKVDPEPWKLYAG